MLVNYVCMWANDEYSTKVDLVMNLINEELHLRNITLETKLKEKDDEIAYLKQELKDANTCMKRIKGSIKIDKHYKKENTYHLFADTKIQYKDSRTIEVILLYNAYDTIRLMNYYAKNNCTDLAKQINPNIFEASYENLIIFLHQVADNTLHINIDYDHLINKLLSSKRIKRNYKPSLFEIYCAKHYNIPLFKYSLTESVGLYKQDRGCDLFDIGNKITAQCKYYTATSLSSHCLSKYFEFVDAMDYDDNYLFVNDDISFASSLTLYDEFLEPINNHTLPIDKTKELYIKTAGNNYITIKFVDTKKFESFVSKLEDKYDEHVSYETFMASLTSLTLKHIQLQKERIASYNNEQLMKEKVDKFNERIHESKDEQFEQTIIKEQREYLKNLIKENPSGIELNECLKVINDKFNVNYDSIRFGHKFSDLYQHTSNSGFPVINNQKMILPVKSIDDEIDFIINYIGIKDILVSDYIEIHNEKFNTAYTTNSFAQKFGKLFKNDGTCFARKTINGQRVHVLELVDSNRHEAVADIVDNILQRYKVLPLPILLLHLHQTKGIYYTPKAFRQEFKNFNLTKGERFTDIRTKQLKSFIDSCSPEQKQEYEEFIQTLKAPVFIS